MPNPFPPSPISSYVLGDTWTPQFTITVGGVNTDPVSLVVRVERPDGSHYDNALNVAVVLTRVAAGIYLLMVPMTQLSIPAVRGTTTPTRHWKIRWEMVVATTQGNETRVGERWAECKPSRLVNVGP